MNLTHTSPAPINQITTNGRFGSFLFFSADEYVMTAGEHHTYTIEIDEDEIIDAARLFWHEEAARLQPFVARVAAMCGVDEDTAEELIQQSADIHSVDSDVAPEDLADMSWEIQHITAQAAVVLGFRGVAMDDEQGTAYLIDMLGREAELQQE
jgi:hypothetical protein